MALRKFGKPVAKKKGFAGNEFNMLTFGIGFLDEGAKGYKMNIKLKSDEAKTPPMDEEGNEYTREEAAALLAEALLEGRGIGVYLFENNDGTMSGNARINIHGLVETPAPKAKPKKVEVRRAVSRVQYQVPDEEEEEIAEEEEAMPY